MNHRISLDLKILLGIAVLTICIPVFSQNNPYYTRLRIVNSNNDTSLSLIMMNTDQDTTLIVQGKRSDNGEWEPVWANWEKLDTSLFLEPSPPVNANTWTFTGIGYVHGRVRVTLGKDSITEPDTILIEIRPDCGPVRGDITFLTPLTHVESGDTITAVIRMASLGFMRYEWSYCRPPSYWCFPDSSNSNILYFDTLGPDYWTASFVITGEASGQLGQWDRTGFPVRECFTNGIDTVRFVMNGFGIHKLLASFDSYQVPRPSVISSPPFMVYPRPTCPCGMSLEIRPHNDTTIASGDSLRFESLILDDTAGIHHEYDTLLAWSLVHSGTGGRLKTQLGSANVFYSDSGAGLYRMAVTCTDVSKFPVSSPLLNRSDTVNVTVAGFQGVVKCVTTGSSPKSPRATVEYYSLRGQKLPSTLYGITRADGIVLERIIEPTGKVNLKKRFVPNP